MYFSGQIISTYNYFFLISILLFVKYMLMYLTFSNLNSIHWLIIKKKKMYFSGHFQDIS